MIASTSRLPGKSSRVSTQATSSPKNRLITATANEIVSVTLNDSMAAFDVTALQNACQPPPADCHTIAASGSSTMTRQPRRGDTDPQRRAAVPALEEAREAARPHRHR